MFRYAQIDENGYVVCDSHLSEEVDYPNMIPISEDFDLVKKRWNGTEWETYEPRPAPEPSQPSLEEMIESVVLNTEYLVVLNEIKESGVI